MCLFLRACYKNFASLLKFLIYENILHVKVLFTITCYTKNTVFGNVGILRFYLIVDKQFNYTLLN